MKKALFFAIPLLGLMVSSCDQPKPEPRQDRKISMNNPSISNSTTSESDRLLQQKIRQTLSNDYALSTAAKNIQVTISNGTVILEGTVNSEREKAMIANKVRLMNGVNEIQNRLEVAANASQQSRY